MKTMSATDVSDTLDSALRFTGLDTIKVNHKHRLLSDNGPCYISGELADYLEEHGMAYTCGRPYHPQTQGMIERYHESLSNLTPADVFYGRDTEILNQRKIIKQNRLAMRKQLHYDRHYTQ
jgi:putative transposase